METRVIFLENKIEKLEKCHELDVKQFGKDIRVHMYIKITVAMIGPDNIVIVM